MCIRDRLKEIRKQSYPEDMLEIWDVQLSKLGTILSILRKDYLEKIKAVGRKIYSGFSSGNEQIGMEYRSTIFPENTELKIYSDELIEKYRRMLEETREAVSYTHLSARRTQWYCLSLASIAPEVLISFNLSTSLIARFKSSTPV